MFDVVKNLMFARQIVFEKGRILLLSQPIVMQPSEVFASLKKAMITEGIDDRDILYHASREAGKKYMQNISRNFGMNLKDALKWGINSFELGGWGITELRDFDLDKKRALVRIENSSVAKEFGSSDRPVDDILRGFLAGAASIIFKEEIACKETKCLSKGDAFCEFVVMRKELFD